MWMMIFFGSIGARPKKGVGPHVESEKTRCAVADPKEGYRGTSNPT